MWYSTDICAGDPKLHIPNSDCHRHALHEHPLQAAYHVCITKYVSLSSEIKGSIVLRISSTLHINKALCMYSER